MSRARRPLSARAFVLGLLAITLLGLGVRALAIRVAPAILPVGDEPYYVSVASNIVAGNGHRAAPHERAFRPPGFPFVLSLVTPDPANAVVLGGNRFLRPLFRLQVALSTALVAITGLAGLALFGRREGLAAAGAVALSPTLIGYSHLLFSETLFAALLTGAVGLAVARRSAAGAAAAGLLFGLAALTREVGLLLGAATAAWIVLQAPSPEPTTALGSSWWARRRHALVHAGLLIVVSLAVIAPWTVRNARIFDHFVLVSNLGWYTAAAGNLLDRPEWWQPPHVRREEFKAAYGKIHDESERAAFARTTALNAIAEEQPSWLPKKILRNGSLVWGPDSFVAYKIRIGGYGPLDLSLARTLVAITVGFYLVLVVSAIAGLAGSRRGGRRWLGLLLLGTFTALHVAAIANTRHRMPMEPLLSIFAAAFWVDPKGSLRNAGRAGRIGAGLALAFLLLVATPYTTRYSHAAGVFAGDVRWDRGIRGN